jgi:hypothetical protein
MKRKLAVLVLAVLVALLAASPALAAGPGGGGREQQHRNGSSQGGWPFRQWFSLVGVITGLDSGSITVQIYNGNRLVQPYIGQELTVEVTGTTRYRQWLPGGCVAISFDDVKVGDTTSVQGVAAEGTFTAQRVTVDVPCCTQE